MTGDGVVHLIWYALALVLVGSALMARRWTVRSTGSMILAWVAIFLVAFLIVKAVT